MEQLNNPNAIQYLREQLLGAGIIPSEVLEWITNENLWNIWVPENFGGLGMSLTEGLYTLQSLAKIDGSLGWTITQCSGANYFIGCMEDEVAREVFQETATPILGGSGGSFGTAEKQGDHYKISGKWRYATGAPYLTHFTFNANIIENGEKAENKDGSPRIRSFIVAKENVNIIEDWDTMGLLPTATHSFGVDEVSVHKKYSFRYNDIHLPQSVYKVPFSMFADLTLWVNYMGMAEHYLEEAVSILSVKEADDLRKVISRANRQIFKSSEGIKQFIRNGTDISKTYVEQVHEQGAESVNHFFGAIIGLHLLLGLKASRVTEQLNQTFLDYFTATQLNIFVGR